MEIVGNWPSVLPPLLAIGLALAFRQVVVALAAGVWVGATLTAGLNPGVGLLRTVDHYAVSALADSDHAAVIAFSLLLGGMVGVIARSGGAHGLAGMFTRFAVNRRRGQLSSWTLGLVIFFDDYSNSLLVGTSMRPITDRLRISREKLAFLVDATAAPVASLAIISSWVGVEIGAIAEQFKLHDLPGDAYLIFLQTIPFRFYPILMLVFGLMLVLSGRDFGPMRKAEQRAVFEGKVLSDTARPAADFAGEGLEPVADKPHRWINAVIPLAVVILAVLTGMWLQGRAALLAVDPTAETSLTAVFGKADSFKVLLWASLLGCLTAISLVVAQRILSLSEAMAAWLSGVKSMVLAIVILVLAWSLGAVCKDLGTAEFAVSAIGGWMPMGLLPAMVFVVAALVSFATGTSWGTMGIMFPLVIPMAAHMAPGDELIMLGAISSVLSGAVWGDHCSPISDTTILSSLASSCDHMDHVRTQLPYALVVGLVSLAAGDLACGLGWYNAWVGLVLGVGLLAAVVFLLGRPVGAGINTRG